MLGQPGRHVPGLRDTRDLARVPLCVVVREKRKRRRLAWLMTRRTMAIDDRRYVAIKGSAIERSPDHQPQQCNDWCTDANASHSPTLYPPARIRRPAFRLAQLPYPPVPPESHLPDRGPAARALLCR